MIRRTPTGTRRGGALAGVALLAVGLGCFGGPRLEPMDVMLERSFSVEETSPLGGDSLAHRRQEMERAHHDMVHFIATLDSLRYRRDRSGAILFGQFLDAYMGTHVAPLLEGDWQSEHPELLGLDATLRLVQAEVLLKMRAPGRMQDTVNEIRRRYAGREDMLVEYPIGEQKPLAEALEYLTHRKWRG